MKHATSTSSNLNANSSDGELEHVNCFLCHHHESTFFLEAEDDLTGKAGRFVYVTCNQCGAVYQNPRLTIEAIKPYYDSEYIAHRKKKDWGWLTPLYEWAMNKHDRDKERIIRRFTQVGPDSKLLDVGCAVGTFLLHMKKKTGCSIIGVDFKEDLSYPGFEQIEFHQGLFYEQILPEKQMDVVTMWHFLEHDYEPRKSLKMAHQVMKDDGLLVIEVPRLDSTTFRWFKHKWPGIQAPQHTFMADKKTLISLVEDSGFVIEKYLPYGAFPPYFYIFTGIYFRLFGKGLRLDRIIFPYFLGQLLLTPMLLAGRYLNLSMQTVICRKK